MAPPPRRHPSCHRHPNLPSTTTGLCAPCLRDRLSLLTPNPNKTSTSTSTSAATLPELRRCKTFTEKNREGPYEPRRKSCDVRGGRNSLSSLFDLEEDEGDGGGERGERVEVEMRRLGVIDAVPEVNEIEIEDDCDDFEVSRTKVKVRDRVRVSEDDEFEDPNSKTMKEFLDLEINGKKKGSIGNSSNITKNSNNISKGNDRGSDNNRKDFKDVKGSFWVAASVFSKKLRKWRKKEKSREAASANGVGGGGGGGGGGGICNADGHDVDVGEMRLERLRGRRLRDTQSEVGEYGFGGRRSCDTDPRGSIDLGRASIDCGAFGGGRRSCDMMERGSIDLGRASIDCGMLGGGTGGGNGRKSCDTEDGRFSIDLGRASVDCGRVLVDEGRGSFDAPRASWDGYLMGGRRGLGRSGGGGGAPMVSVIENAMATVYGFDHRVLADGKMKMENGDERDSVGSNRVKDHYLDVPSLLRRKKGFNGSNSMKKTEDGEGKALSDARVSPTTIGIYNGTKLLITEKELNEWRLNSLKDDSSESFETASKDLASVSSSSSTARGSFKKCRQWSKLWSIWGLLHRRKGDKCDGEGKLEGDDVESLHGDSADNMAKSGRNGETVLNPGWKLVRSHSTTSSRGSSSAIGSFRGAANKPELNSKALVKKRPEDVVLERSRSSRYSPGNLDNGLLRFYLTPLRSRRRSKLGKGKLKNSRSLARSVFKL